MVDSAEHLDTFTIALAEPVDLSHAPNPINESERLVFRQLFETLVRLDCQGKLQPDLATSWHPDSTGRNWTFVIRDGARFPDGSSLTARSVRSDWHTRWSRLQAVGLDSVKVLDDRTLLVAMRDLRDSLPHLFADPLFSVTSQVNSSAASNGRIALPPGPTRPTLEIEASPRGDLRDALDAGGDLVVSGDPEVVDYAASRGEFEIFPLPWDRTYALLQHAGSEPLKANVSDSTIHQSLARDAVQTEARPARSPYWWNGPCAIYTSMHVTLPTAPRVVYLRTDVVARQLAERMVALAGDSPSLSAVGMDPSRFADALKHGGDRGYIVALPLRPVSPCRESAEWTSGAYLQPLIDTRARAIVRRGSPALSVEWDGTVRVARPEGSTAEARP